MKHSGKLMAALAAAGLMVLFGAGAALCAEQTRDSISVTGYASQESEPDMAVVSLSLTEYGKTAADTRAALASRIDKLNKYIASLRIAAKDVKTSGYELAPNYEMVREKRVQKGYAASAVFTVTVRNMAGLGAVIDGSAEKCSAMINDVSFGLQNREEIERSLLAAAVEDAKGRAAAVASAGGRRLGALISASIGSAGAAPQPRMMKGFAGDAMNVAAAPATQLSPGVIKVAVSMSLIFELANR